MVGEIHKALRLAVAFGLRHAEIVLDTAFGVETAFLPDDHAWLAAKASQTADNRQILAENAVARQGREFFDQLADVIDAMRTIDMARDLNLLRGGKLVVERVQLPVDLVLKTTDFAADVHMTIAGQMPKLLDLGFELGNGFFKVQNLHWLL
jgi:hypothetical protein